MKIEQFIKALNEVRQLTPQQALDQVKSEYQEFLDAKTPEEEASEIVDLFYVLTQYAIAQGIDLQQYIDCVTEANYTKFMVVPEETPKGWRLAKTSLGYVFLDENNKLRKPLQFKKCDLS